MKLNYNNILSLQTRSELLTIRLQLNFSQTSYIFSYFYFDSKKCTKRQYYTCIIIFIIYVVQEFKKIDE